MSLGSTLAIERRAKRSVKRRGETPPKYPLKIHPRHMEVARLIFAGLRNDAIARALNKTPGTIGQYVFQLFRLTGCHSRLEVANWFARIDRKPNQRVPMPPPVEFEVLRMGAFE